MSGDDVDAVSTVQGTRTVIPTRVRRELDIEAGDRLRWHLESDDRIRVEVVTQPGGTFAKFDGYDRTEPTDATSDHDTWGCDDT
ncbi:AbrB/MazE/SpoVT family DNA-binding domain-containing protein [Halococcoides cellulosivorans]|uniref:AbrB family transcriptional regulator n=1 Tax=Halococcoides cellulosivorans TaxID=1679096 RepID=A0A2R4WYM8_9EURY|nr:AbrB/MazE/SpoVT family DNA-binding domain-containing protein [Halococcoides cellulosivorans]AWB26641.1 AbrB family transcriptional regulator [Halococcoides cellulosivorans]